MVGKNNKFFVGIICAEVGESLSPPGTVRSAKCVEVLDQDSFLEPKGRDSH